MKITDNTISMQAEHNSRKIHTQTENFRFWIGERSELASGNSLEDNAERRTDLVQISEIAKQMQKKVEQSNSTSINQPVKDVEEVEFTLSEKDKSKIILIEKFLEQLKGKKVKLQVPDKLKIKDDVVELELQEKTLQFQQNQSNELEGWGLEYDYHESYYESEELAFKAKGEIHAADGSVINFSLKMNLKREYLEETNISIKAGDATKPKAVDPLTISFTGETPDLTDAKFRFDLDADGNIDQISFVKPGSGFLALDQNGDGTINDGSELFGPTLGNGFIELAKHDADQNEWIDENDPIFDQLRIWTKNEAGEDHLLALGQVGVGAIYLGHIDTPFSLTNDQNVLNGQISRSGIYVNEDKSVGTIHQVDLVI